MSNVDDELRTQRKQLGERFTTEAVAYTSDGRDIGFAGPVELGVEVGGFAMVAVPDGDDLVVQVRELNVVEREGLSIDLDVSDGDVPTTWTTPT